MNDDIVKVKVLQANEIFFGIKLLHCGFSCYIMFCVYQVIRRIISLERILLPMDISNARDQ